MTWNNDPSAPPTDITIVGGGPVGMYAAFHAALQGASVRLIESLPQLGGQPKHLYPEKLIYDVPGYPQIRGAELIQQLMDQMSLFDPEVITGQTATSIETGDTSVQIRAGRTWYESSAVILATGFGAFKPKPLPGLNLDSSESSRVLYRIQRADIDRVSDRLGRQPSFLVVGGGDSACDRALTLSAEGYRVTLVHRRHQFRALPGLIDQLKQAPVTILTPYTVDRVIETKTDLLVDLKHQKDGSVKRVNTHFIIPSIGVQPDPGPLKTWGLSFEGNGLPVERSFRTNLPRVFAVGDIAQYPGKSRLLATGFGEAPVALQHIRQLMDPAAPAHVQHSTALKK